MAVGCQGRGSDMERNQPEPGVWHWGNGNCSWLPVCKAMGRSLAAVWGGNEHPLRGHSPPGITEEFVWSRVGTFGELGGPAATPSPSPPGVVLGDPRGVAQGERSRAESSVWSAEDSWP